MATNHAWRHSHCYVPMCDTGYKSCKTKYSLFSVPKDEKMFTEWDRRLHRADMKLQRNCRVCERHFDNRYIIRHDSHIINGEVVTLKRIRPILTKDAIPTIFPSAPNYLSKLAPKKRKSRNLPAPQTAKKLKSKANEAEPKLLSKNEAASSDGHSRDVTMNGGCPTNEELSHTSSNVLTEKNPLENLPMPSAMWTCVRFINNNVIGYSTQTLSPDNEIQSEKLLLFSKLPGECTVVLKGRTHKTIYISNREEAILQLQIINELILCEGVGTFKEFERLNIKSSKYLNVERNQVYAKGCYTESPKQGGSCLKCKQTRKNLLTRNSKIRTRKIVKNAKKNTNLHMKQLRRRETLIKNLKNVVDKLKERNENISESVLNEKIKLLPAKQQDCVMHCFKAAQRKSTQGFKYSEMWMLECIIMRMKSPRLYEHLRRHKILILPGRTSLRKYLKNFKSCFGFNPKLCHAIKKKTSTMEHYQLHGGLVFDEMKLSEHLTILASGKVEGLVDLGPYMTDGERTSLADHGLVVVFQPFTGPWTQIIGVFAARGNVKADILTKLITEATIICEQAGLFVDYICCDGATWNRSMWRKFNVGTSNNEIRCKIVHPVDPKRSLYFISDFPHLMKCLRNILLDHGFNTPSGTVRKEHIVEAWNQDSSNITLKAMPSITYAHLYPSAFDRLRVNLAFHIFSTQVLKGLYLYSSDIYNKYGSFKGTEEFINLMRQLIEIMTSRHTKEALRPNSQQLHFLEQFLLYLDDWECFAKLNGGGFLSQSTATGLRVTISSTISLLNYLHTSLNYRYLMTSRLSQDCIERLFGIIRQSSGTNTNPTPSQFLVIVNCMSFYNLARAPKEGNCDSGTVSALLHPDDQHKVASLEQQVDNCIDCGNLEEARAILDHVGYVANRSNSQLIYYIAGYVARKHVLKVNCDNCKNLCLQSPDESINLPHTLTTKFTKGGLLYPTDTLFNLVNKLETYITRMLSFNKIHADSLLDILQNVHLTDLVPVGCSVHAEKLTANIVKFYCCTRLHFFVKGDNKARACNQKKRKLNNLAKVH